MDFHIDRAVWPQSDNSVVASRYHSSADKASGDAEFPQIENSTSLNKQPDGNGKDKPEPMEDNRMSKRSFHWKIFICLRRFWGFFPGMGVDLFITLAKLLIINPDRRNN
ncbi:hypothetical protein TcasGA2_TC000900 [Tribolium castaneum]|uniref:Uncharacterized protein n=1 Tax=Tribolium castaneum TaxID=7070 RepID=D6W919_TRICA|nr:hypothetical protein TcasGA2_TC000900 [Tribolium castaneum]